MNESIHLSIELVCTFLAFIIIVPNFLTFALYKERFRLCLGIGFLVAGVTNLLHALMVHSTGIEAQSVPEFFVPLSGFMPRFILPLSLACAIIFDKYFKKSKTPTMEIFTLGPIIFLIFIFITILIGDIETSVGLIFRNQLLHRPMDMMAGILAFSIIPFCILKKETLWRFFTIGLFFLATSSVVLSFSEALNSPMYISAHIIKLLAFLSFASGIIYDTWKIRDLETKRYELYNNLKLQKEFNENVLKNIGDGVYVTDCEKNVLIWSIGAELITGYSSSEAIGRKCSEFLKHCDDDGNILCETPRCPINKVNELKAITKPETTNITTRFGINKKIELIGAPIIKESGEISNIVEVFRDVTEEREAQKQLRIAHEKLVKLNELKDNLTHMIVHDLKNPLTSIISTAELLEYEKNIPREEEIENIQIISSEARRLLNMINSLLDIEKFESDKMKLEITPVNINDIIRSEINLMKIPAQLRNVKIEFDEKRDLPLCKADTVHCSRVIMNLLDNAIKYAKTRIKITCEESPENHEELIICIEDDGPGIPDEYHTKIFEKFETVEARKEWKKYSTGLGLTFCKVAVESMGGRIWVESEKGQGSRFYFTLPVAEQ